MRNGSQENSRILIADKEPLFLHGLRASIEGSFQIVGEAATSQEVLALLSLHQPRLLIVGFQLACGRDALGLAPEFRRRKPRHRHYRLSCTQLRFVRRTPSHRRGARRPRPLQSHRRHPCRHPQCACRRGLRRPLLTDTPRYPATAQADTSKLSDREREIFYLLGMGKSYKDIAALLSISTKTVERHRANIKARLHLNTVCDLCSLAKARVLSESSGADYVI